MVTMVWPWSLCYGWGHHSTARIPCHCQGHCALPRITILRSPCCSGHSVPWAGVGCPCNGHHPMPVSPGSGKGCLCYGPLSSWAVGRRAMPWPGARGGHHATQLTSAVDTDPKTNTPSVPRAPERVAVTLWGPSEALQPGGLSDLAQARGWAGCSSGSVAENGGEGLAAALCCCTPTAGARKGK